MITPPPPPTTPGKADKNDEKGEAPMDMETDEKPDTATTNGKLTC